MGNRAVLCLAILGVITGTTSPAGDKKPNKLPADVQAILNKADTFELYSLDPERSRNKKDAGGADFRGWTILGKTAVKDAETRKRLVTALYDGIAKSDGSGARCFDPRHGIRASAEGKSVDLVICFECSWVYVFLDK